MRTCDHCGQELKSPRMTEAAFRELLEEIGGHRGAQNRVVKWITEIEQKEGLTEAIFTLEDYMKGG